MRQDKQKTNWLINAVLFGGFLGALWLDLTGMAVHQWLGLAVGALAGYHLWKHWRWVEAVTARFFGRTSRQSRTFYVVDAGLAVGFGIILVTGLVISTWLDLSLVSYAVWRTVHVAASIATLALLVAKIGLHWRWIIGVARRNIFPAPAPSRRTAAAQSVPVTAQVPLGRRDFVRLMAGVGAVTLLTGVNPLKKMFYAPADSVDNQAEASAAIQATSTTPAPSTTSSTALTGSVDDQTEASAATQATSATLTPSTTSSARTSDSCTVRCSNQCSYPGRCRKYVDANNNGRCDLGECLL
jgi:hypothetical protein